MNGYTTSRRINGSAGANPKSTRTSGCTNAPTRSSFVSFPNPTRINPATIRRT